MDALKETAIALQEEWGVQAPDIISEAAILERLAARVVQLIEGDSERFFQLMYRLDISEKKLNEALLHLDAPEKIARLIYDRQVQKIHSRAFFRNNNSDADAEMKW